MYTNVKEMIFYGACLKKSIAVDKLRHLGSG